MFHDIVKIYIEKGTKISCLFIEGVTKEFDMSTVFSKIPQLQPLKDRKLFQKAYLRDPWSVAWNDELDFEGEDIYDSGKIVPNKDDYINALVGYKIKKARLDKEMSQKKLSTLTHIDQGDISKIENGYASITLSTLYRISKALNKKLLISLE